MSIEEAIKQLEQLQRFCSIMVGQSKDGAFAKDWKALEMAIAALRAQQTKLDRSLWDGCDWCKSAERPADEHKCGEMFAVRGVVYTYCGDGETHGTLERFCPLCGKPLTEEAWAELERRIKGG